MPCSRHSVRKSFRICAWIVTSSAVVGSSAIRSFRRPATAIASITRCFMPPEARAGTDRPCAPARRCRRGRAARSPRRVLARRRSPGAAPAPPRSVARRAAPGSARSSAPGTPSRSSRRGSCGARLPGGPSSSLPSSRTLPPTRAFGGKRPMAASAVTDFPEPDSPTSATVWPGAIAKSTERTAGSSPASLGNETVRSRTSSKGLLTRAPSAAWGSWLRAALHPRG